MNALPPLPPHLSTRPAPAAAVVSPAVREDGVAPPTAATGNDKWVATALAYLNSEFSVPAILAAPKENLLQMTHALNRAGRYREAAKFMDLCFAVRGTTRDPDASPI